MENILEILREMVIVNQHPKTLMVGPTLYAAYKDLLLQVERFSSEPRKPEAEYVWCHATRVYPGTVPPPHST